MYRALVGLFDHLHEAEETARDLQTGGVRVTRLRVWSEFAADDPLATGQYPSTVGDRWPADTTYIRQRLEDMGVDLISADGYAEGVRRGYTLLTAVVEEAEFEPAMEILQRHNAIDIHRRIEEWSDEMEGTPPRRVLPPETQRAPLVTVENNRDLQDQFHGVAGWMLVAVAVVILAAIIYFALPERGSIEANPTPRSTQPVSAR